MTDFMQLALEQAERAAQQGEVPIGAVLVDPAGTVIASAHNLTETQHDPTAHAELLVIREGARLLAEPRLVQCDLYVTLEPCAMCAAAISHARIRRLYYGAYDAKGGAIEHGPKWFQQPTCLHRPEIYGGLLEQATGQLLRDFFHARR